MSDERVIVLVVTVFIIGWCVGVVTEMFYGGQ